MQSNFMTAGLSRCTISKSCGAVVYRMVRGCPEFLLFLQSAFRRWSFPKGHMEPGESETQTALREIREETGMRVTLQGGFRAEMHDAVPPRSTRPWFFFWRRHPGRPLFRRMKFPRSAGRPPQRRAPCFPAAAGRLSAGRRKRWKNCRAPLEIPVPFPSGKTERLWTHRAFLRRRGARRENYSRELPKWLHL